MKYSPLYFIGLIIILCSCSLKSEKEKDALTSKVFNDEFAIYFKDGFDVNQISSSKPEIAFYNLNQISPIWIDNNSLLNESGKEFMKIIENSNYYGLDRDVYSFSKLRDLSNKLKQTNNKEDKREIAASIEIALTKNYLLFGKHLNYGLINNVDTLSSLPRKEFNLNLVEYLNNAYEKDSLISNLLKLQPKQIGYKNLQMGLENFLKKNQLSSQKVVVKNYKLDSIKSYALARESLELHNYIESNSSDTVFIHGLKKFQYEHGLKPDGVIGTNTALALSKSPYEYYQSAAASLERWRWKEDWENDYIHVNIPSFKLKYVVDNALHAQNKVVVGSLSNRTPEIYSKLSYLVAYPYWHVPKSISVNEILVKAKDNSDYISRNRYEIFNKKMEPVNANDINWDTISRSNFNYYIRQRGGSSNALGLVKFIFDNKYSIYLHDTPTKYHFDREIRAYSHGCVRVQDALKLADNILTYDENTYNIDSVLTYVEKRKEKKMPVSKNIPIYIQYIVCDADENNTIIFNKDVYKKDVDVIELLFNNHLAEEISD